MKTALIIASNKNKLKIIKALDIKSVNAGQRFNSSSFSKPLDRNRIIITPFFWGIGNGEWGTDLAPPPPPNSAGDLGGSHNYRTRTKD
jgi:hypothetical protein